VHEIGLAEHHDVPLLPAIERRACDMFLSVPATASLPSCLTPLENFEAAQRAGLLWVARVNAFPVGFALVEPLGDGLHLEELDVLPEHGRKGIGRALLREVCRHAKAQSRVLTLCTFRDVPWNAPLYERLGFQALGSEDVWPVLSERVAKEAAHGLAPHLRVAMRFVAGAGNDVTADAGSQALAAETSAFAERNPKSLERFQAATLVMPGGNTRSSLYHDPFPLTIVGGQGCRVWDADGHEYLDFLGEFTAGVYGHSDPTILAAIISTLGRGINLSGQNALEVELARIICDRFPSIDLVRFTNSGTEANLMALAAATVFTGRRKILVFEGAYHGGVLSFANGASPVNVPHEFLLSTYNDVDRTLHVIEAHGNELAAILIEPMIGSGGCIPADVEFLRALRGAATAEGALLIFDEVMTSRLAPGGRQEALNVIPDLCTLGKYLGGGMSFGAFGGRKDVMQQFDPRRPGGLPHAGTFNNNVVTMSAGIAGLTKVFQPAAVQALNARGDALRTRLNLLCRELGAQFQFTGIGSLMSAHATGRPIRTPADAARGDRSVEALFFFDMLERGVYLARKGFIALSLPIGCAEVDHFADAVGSFLDTRRDLIVTR
jgi:glutamate-1-semialdehyde 2,1-aminomutase